MRAVTREPELTHESPSGDFVPPEAVSCAPPAAVTAHALAGLPATGVLAASPSSLVVIVASSRAEQQRLLAGLPEDVPVLLTASAEQAEELLHALPAPDVPPLGLTVRIEERTVTCGARSVRLTPLELALLRTLISEQGRVWSFAELSDRVWATGFVGDGAQVRAVVKRLRAKLAQAGAPVVVETVRGAGFRIATGPDRLGGPR